MAVHRREALTWDLKVSVSQVMSWRESASAGRANVNESRGMGKHSSHGELKELSGWYTM